MQQQDKDNNGLAICQMSFDCVFGVMSSSTDLSVFLCDSIMLMSKFTCDSLSQQCEGCLPT